jgi:hypothetical protein
MSTVATLKIAIGSAFDGAGFREAAKALQPLGDRLQSVGGTLSAYVTAPLVALGVASVRAFDQSAKAVAAVESRLKSTGGAAGFTSQQLQRMAADLQKVTTFDDDEILSGVTQQLLTFPSIAGEAFSGAQVAALNLSTVLGTSLQSSAIMLGKALQDPVQGLTAMRRVGISFSASQQEVIKRMAETGNLAGAQALILAELERQYGGAAEAAAKAGLGPFQQFGNAMGDVSERIGKVIVEGLTPLLNVGMRVAAWFNALPDPVVEVVTVLGMVVAAIGPLLFGLGSLIKLLPLLAAGWAALTGPIGLTIIAITAVGTAALLIYKHWEGVTAFFGKLWQGVSQIFGASMLLLLEHVKLLWPKAQKYFLMGIQALIGPLAKFAAFLGAGDLAGSIQGFADSVGGLIPASAIAEGEARIKQLEGKLVGGMLQVGSAVADAWGGAKEALAGGGGANPLAPGGGGGTGSGGGVLGAVDALRAKIQQTLLPAGQLTEKLKQMFGARMATELVNQRAPTDSGTHGLLGGVIGPDMLRTVTQPAMTALDTLALKMLEKKNQLAALSADIGGAIQDGLTGAIVSVSEAIGGLAAGTSSMGDVGRALLGSVAGLMQKLGGMLISFGTAGLLFQANGGFLSFLTNPAAAIGVGALLVAAGAAVKGLLGKGSAGGGGGSARGVSSIGVNANAASTAGSRGFAQAGGGRGAAGSAAAAAPVLVQITPRATSAGDLVWTQHEGTRRHGRQGASMY